MRRKRNLPARVRLLSLIASSVLFAPLVHPPRSEAHRSGCHAWHSCPSDTGAYTCGDLGYCSGCPDNEFCEAGQPRHVPLHGSPEPAPSCGPDEREEVITLRQPPLSILTAQPPGRLR
jgi:hypothetical protein